MHRERRGATAAPLILALAVVAAAAGVWFFAASKSTTAVPAPTSPRSAVEGGRTTPVAADGYGGQTSKEPQKPSYELLFPDWPEQPKPAFVIALTGEMNGYLRPCGCSEGQSGGLARRAGLLAFLRDTLKLNVLAVDLGDVIGGTPKIEELRFDAARKGLAKLGYKVVALGRQDYSIPLLTLIQKLSGDADGLKTVLGNVKAADKDMHAILAEACKQVEIIEVAGRKVAVGSLMDPEFVKGNSEIQLDPVDAASAAMLKAAAAGKAEAKVLLAYMTKEKAKEFAQKHPGWDVILTRSNGDDVATAFDQHREGNTLIVQAGRKGKWTGVVGYWPDAQFKYRYAAVEATGRLFPEDASLEEVYSQFVKQVAESDVLTTWSKLPHANGGEYVGAETCGKCHTKAYKKWKEEVADSTHGKGHGHAFAFESLKKDKAKYQTSNPECVKCHVTGFDYRTGFVTEAKTPKLLGNQCENCHGPGSRHAANKDDLEARKGMKLSQFEAEKKLCGTCHDADNSPKFDFKTYWPKIAHPWRD